jgi:hypothetical protein
MVELSNIPASGGQLAPDSLHHFGSYWLINKGSTCSGSSNQDQLPRGQYPPDSNSSNHVWIYSVSPSQRGQYLPDWQLTGPITSHSNSKIIPQLGGQYGPEYPKYHFFNITIDWGVTYDFSSYEELKSKDLNLISNSDLRSDIISYYRFAENYATIFTNRYSDIIDNASRSIFSKHFDQMWSTRIDNPQGEMIPNDYERLRKDKEFMYFLKTLKNQNYWFIENVINTSNDSYKKITKAQQWL